MLYKISITFGVCLVLSISLVAPAAAQTHDAATEEQQETQEDVARRARELMDRFTDRQPSQPTETTTAPEMEPETTSEPEPFDPGPTESLAETQQLNEPVDNLPDSGFGISLVGLALGFTTLKHHKRLAKHFGSNTSNS